MKNITNFIFESYVLKRMPRSGGYNLGSPLGSIAEHSFFVSLIGLVLAAEENVDPREVVVLSLLHDLVETRVGDGNYVNKKYQVLDECGATKEQIGRLPKKVKHFFEEYIGKNGDKKVKELEIMEDADALEQMFSEKFALEQGNVVAKKWMDYSLSRLKTATGKKIGEMILKMHSGDWLSEVYK